MASLTHTVGGDNNLVSFRSAARVPIESLKAHFKPIQEGEGVPSPENMRPIAGWNGCQVYKTGKNVGQVVGYNAQNTENADVHNDLTNSYGTTINTNNYNLPDTSLIITQSQAPNSVINNYRNGYFSIMVKNLIYGKYYDVSFKIADIKSNPLNANLQNLILLGPDGGYNLVSKVVNNIVIFKNILWKRYSNLTDSNYNRSNFEIRNCGMSFTLSEFMVTPAGMNDGIFEPYCGEVLPITFPNISKNLFEFTPFNETDWSTNYVPLSPTTDTDTNTITITGYGSGDSQLYNLKNVYYPGTYTFSFDMTYVSENTYIAKRMVIRCYDDNDELMDNNDLSIEGFTYNQYYRGWWAVPTTFTVPDSVNYFKLSIGVGGEAKGDTVSFSNIQLEYGETATTYEPYNPNNTVYGGYIDIVKGELVKEYDILTLTGYEDITWLRWSDETIYTNNTVFQKKPNWNTVSIDGYCNYSERDTNNVIHMQRPSMGSYGFEFNQATSYWKITEPTPEALVAKLKEFTDSGNPFQLVYKLYTPERYPLSAEQLSTFISQNNIWSNTNDITEVSYAIHDTTLIRAAKKRMVAENSKHYRKVLWNQMAGPMTNQYWKIYNGNVISANFIDDYAEITINGTTSSAYATSIYTSNEPPIYNNHYYYGSYMIEPQFSDGKFYMELAGGATPGVQSATINTWSRISSSVCKGLRTGNGRLYIPNFVNNTYQIGDKVKVKNAIYIDLTMMFGKGKEPNKKEFERLCEINNIDLTAYHPIDTGTEQIWCIPDHNTDHYITVEWNQYCRPLNSTNWVPYNSNYSTVTFADNTITRIVNQEVNSYSQIFQTAIKTNYYFNIDTTHLYYIKQEIYSEQRKAFLLIAGNKWAKNSIVEPNTWTILETITNPSVSSGTTGTAIFFVGYTSELSQINDTCQIKNPIFIDLTQMFGAGNEPTTPEALRAMCLKNNINLDEFQPYSTGTKIIWKV